MTLERHEFNTAKNANRWSNINFTLFEVLVFFQKTKTSNPNYSWQNLSPSIWMNIGHYPRDG